MVPSQRLRACNDAAVREDGDFVLYWMVAARRVRWNYGLDRAVEWALELDRPLLVLEGLRCDYPWASDRAHRFVIDGMRDNEAALAGSGIGYRPWVEPERGASKGLLESLASRASVVVTDEHPGFFYPRMLAAAAGRLGVRLEAVDSNGLLPLTSAGKVFHRAFDFRRLLQQKLPDALMAPPRQSVLQGTVPRPFSGLPPGVEERWPRAAPGLLNGTDSLARLPIDHAVEPVGTRGGYDAGQRSLRAFLDDRLQRYDEQRNEPASPATSGLSPYLHFGHVSPHQVLDGIARRRDWSPWKLEDEATGKRRGWWGLDEASEAFLDQLVTWRELGFVFAHHRADHEAYDTLPEWARETLHEHEADERPSLYELGEFEAAATHDEIWNAAQRELVRSGTMHNYLRMLWGKKILHWSRTPHEALDVMLELNNKYALDGRDPNSTSGIFWVLGRFDRAWGPEREVFGKVRYMSSRNTRRKLRLEPYLERWSAGTG